MQVSARCLRTLDPRVILSGLLNMDSETFTKCVSDTPTTRFALGRTLTHGTLSLSGQSVVKTHARARPSSSLAPLCLPQVPDLSLGMSYCLTNNVFGTNFVLWMPYREEDRNLKFR